MRYTWESEKIVMISVSPDQLQIGTVLAAQWQQKFICRMCKGVGCQSCDHVGHFTKTRTQSVQIRDQVTNGSWLRFSGVGDERPDFGGYGDVVLQIHINGMEKPGDLDPACGNTVDNTTVSYDSIFNQFFGEFSPPPVSANISLTPQEAKTGCLKQITIPITLVCETCRGCGMKSGYPQSVCASCNGSGHLVNEQTLSVQVPPNTKNKTKITLAKSGNTKMMNGELKTGNVAVTVKIKRFSLWGF